MLNLNLPEYDFRTKQEDGKVFVLDRFRKKYVLLTPEEEVRQRLAAYMISELAYPASLMRTEVSLRLNDMVRRCDILVDKPAGRPMVLVECKAPEVRIAQAAFDQAARYNLVLKVPYLILSNGLLHYCCHVDVEKQKVEFMDHLPAYREI